MPFSKVCNPPNFHAGFLRSSKKGGFGGIKTSHDVFVGSLCNSGRDSLIGRIQNAEVSIIAPFAGPFECGKLRPSPDA